MELSAAEEYAIRIIAAESALQHAARDEAPAARPSASTAVTPDGKAGSPAPVAGGTDASRPTLAPGGTATTETNHPVPIPLPVSLLVPPIPDGLWPAVRSELEAQSVIGYPANAIESLGLSPADQAEYLARAGKNLSSWYRLMMAQDSVLAEFRQAGIPVAVLKGAAAAANYPQPNSRSMGDIDLIVPPDHFEQAFSLMERLGWENDIELELNPRHAGFKKAGCPEIELHRYFSTCTNSEDRHQPQRRVLENPRGHWPGLHFGGQELRLPARAQEGHPLRSQVGRFRDVRENSGRLGETAGGRRRPGHGGALGHGHIVFHRGQDTGPRDRRERHDPLQGRGVTCMPVWSLMPNA